MRLITLAMIGLTSSAALAAGDPPFRIDFTPVGFYEIPATDVAYARAFDELCLTTQFYFDFAEVNPDGTIDYVQRVNTNFLVADTGAIMEQVTAELFPNDFNSTNDQNDSFDNRSDDKGPEPEGLAIGRIGERTLVFVGLERIGGVMAFDVSDPTAPAYAGYVNTRDFNGIPPLNAGDLDPAGLEFIPAEYSPNDSPMLAVAFGESQVTRLFQIDIAIACLGDVNLSGGVDAADIGLLLASWGACGSEECPADVNGSGQVDAADIGLLLANWGACSGEG